MLKSERIQRIATKMVPDLEDLTWEKVKKNNNNYNIIIDKQPGIKIKGIKWWKDKWCQELEHDEVDI